MEHPQYPGMEIDAAPRQQKREWAIQRIAWVLMYGLLAAIAFGLLGKGPLSKATLAAGNGSLKVEYEKFLRHRSPDTLQITLQTESGTVEVRLASRYLRGIQIRKVSPEPEETIVSDGYVAFVFNAQPNVSMQAAIEFEPQQVGRLEGWIAVDDKPRLQFSQFVYP